MRTVAKEQILKKIQDENPWWQTHYQPTLLTPRPYLDLLYPLITNRTVRRAVVIMGPRRVGKTVMVHHAIDRLLNEDVEPRRICYISVDHPIYNGLGLEQLLEFYSLSTGINFKQEEFYIFFDEIQYLRNWEVHLKTIVDAYEGPKCIVTGSAAAALRLKSYESGAGRFTDFLLPPLTFHEYLYLLKTKDIIPVEEKNGTTEFIVPDISKLNERFVDYLNFGGYPEVLFSEDIRKDPGRYIKSDIIDKVLLRDLPSLYGIQDVQELNYLFTTLAFNTANEVSLEELSKGSGVAKNTLKRYIEYLEAAFLVRIVHRVDKNAKRFKRANHFKVYLTNPSIRSALFSPIDADDETMGYLVETGIFAQWFHSMFAKLHYARWKNGEVDIVSLGEKEKVSWAVEAKWTDRYYKHPSELKSLIDFCNSRNLERPLVTTRTAEGIKTIKNITIEFQPASVYTFTLGYNILKGKSKILRPSRIPR